MKKKNKNEVKIRSYKNKNMYNKDIHKNIFFKINLYSLFEFV